MRQTKLLGLLALALLAFSGIIASTALAADELPNVLPDAAGFPLSASSECPGQFIFGNELIKLSTQETKGCVGTQEQSNSMTGTFKTTFLGVKDSTGRKCSTAGKLAGEVEVTGTFDTQDAKIGGKLTVVSTTRPTQTIIKCGTLEITVKGCTAGALTPESKLAKSLTLTFALNAAKTDNEPVEVLNLAATANEQCENLSKSDAGVFRLSAQTGVITISKFMQAGKEVEVLVMPL